MSDAWSTTTLGSLFPGPAATIGNIKLKADALFARYDALRAKMDAKVGLIQGAVNDTLSFGEALGAAGFYKLELAPGPGGWASRAMSAPGAPPDDGYCSGMIIIAYGPDPSGVTSSFNSLKSIMTTPVKVA